MSDDTTVSSEPVTETTGLLRPAEADLALARGIGTFVEHVDPVPGASLEGAAASFQSDTKAGSQDDGPVSRGPTRAGQKDAHSIPSPEHWRMQPICLALPLVSASGAVGLTPTQSFLSAADQLLTVAAYARIGSDLGALNSTSWLSTAYFLTVICFQPLYGKLCDIFGRKACLLFAYVAFAMGTLGCGLAPNMPFLIASRAVGGIGGAGMNAIVAILLTDIVPLRDRGVWQAYANIIFAAGSATGAPLGGLLVV